MIGTERLARAIGEPRPHWWHAALCRGLDPEMFFTDRGESTSPAKSICDQCVVREECLDYALGNSEKFGIWGGTTEQERRRLRRQRRAS